MRYVLFGTSDFALPALEGLLSLSEHKLIKVITTPAKPVGRRQELQPSPVQHFAEQHNIPFLAPSRLKDILQDITNMQPDFGVVVSYGKIIPQEVIDLFPHGIINIHASLLPRHRGASPIQNALLHGDAETGVTIMLINAGMDTGPMISRASLPLTGKETSSMLFERLAPIGRDLLMQTLPDYLQGSLHPVPQNDSEATYAPIIKKEAGHIDWSSSARAIERQLRAYTPWPGIYSFVDGMRIRILGGNVRQAELKNDDKIGILQSINNHLSVQTGCGIFEITQLQREGKKPQDANTFLRGNGQLIGKKLT